MNDPTLACVFPGQGSQSIGMLGALAQAEPEIGRCFAEASDVLGYDLWKLTQEGPEAELNQTERTQPALLAAGVAVWRLWRARGGALPAVMAGHSLGEYTALVCAEAMDYPDALALVAERGRQMQRAVPAGTGTMAAILGLDDEAVRVLCAEQARGEVVAAVNYNAPGQVVIAGHAAAVERAMAAAKAAGAKRALPLAVSAPSHCALMQPAAQALAEQMQCVPIRAPRIPVLHNADVTASTDPKQLRDALLRQLYNPVRWVETIRAMAAQGVTTVIECGPGKVLSGLNKRIAPELRALCIHDPASLDEALKQQEVA